VSSKQAWRGRWSRRSEISSSGLREQWMGSTSLGVIGLAAAVSTIATAFLGLAAAGLAAATVLGTGFLGLAVLLVAISLDCLGASVTVWG
jgi:hypothetical protein